MRFSLTTLLLVAFWLATLMLVWVWREPWIPILESVSVNDILKLNIPSSTDDWNALSPDHTRSALGTFDHVVRIRILGVGEVAQIIGFGSNYPKEQHYEKNHSYPNATHFLDNNTLVIRGILYSDRRSYEKYWLYKRRFPEWWWGHFYRPEVWLALALTVALLWQTAKARRSSRVPNPIPAPAETRP